MTNTETSQVSEYERLFGRPTGRHTHPDTHPYWMEFSDGACVVCAQYQRPAGRRRWWRLVQPVATALGVALVAACIFAMHAAPVQHCQREFGHAAGQPAHWQVFCR